ncbi:hypothetical protein, partial [Campylobacter jejuni]|uniref:hypothetical protein n=1 Tax=Campylobacter jejuni TaxID=197 RepID=UPI002B233252
MPKNWDQRATEALDWGWLEHFEGVEIRVRAHGFELQGQADEGLSRRRRIDAGALVLLRLGVEVALLDRSPSVLLGSTRVDQR